MRGPDLVTVLSAGWVKPLMLLLPICKTAEPQVGALAIEASRSEQASVFGGRSWSVKRPQLGRSASSTAEQNKSLAIGSVGHELPAIIKY